ncbi:MAG: DMT family transporter [Dehalobacterium sp.]
MAEKPIFTDKKFVAIIASLCCLLWGSAYPSIKNGYLLFNINSTDIPSKLLFAGYRFIIAGLILSIFAQKYGQKIFSLNKNNLSCIFILGILQTTMQYLFFYIGVANTTGIKGSIMGSTITFFSAILAHFVYANDKLTTKKIIGCILGFIGVMSANFSSDLFKFSFSFMGDGFVIVSAFFAAVAAIYSKNIFRNMDLITVTGYSLFIGGTMLALLGILCGGKVHHFTLSSSSILIYLALATTVSFFLWNLLIKYNKVGSLAVYNFLTPIFGAILSSIFLGETILELKNFIAFVLVFLGIWMVNKTSQECLKQISNEK